MEEYMLPCLNKKLFGLDCLGCGLQRSFAFLIRGDFESAFHMYPGIFPLILLVAFFVATIFITFKYQRFIKITLITITLSTVVISYIIKMSHFFQLTN